MMARYVGQVVINPWDVVGKVYGTMEVIQYIGKRYSETDGGSRMRHYYACRCLVCGRVKRCQRGNLKAMANEDRGCKMQAQ